MFRYRYTKTSDDADTLYEISNPTTMKKDKLNIDSFTNKEGKNYRRSEMLEKEEIGTYFSKKGYQVIELQQIWRHVHGKLKKDNKIFFLKMASTPDIGERTQNETLWNNQIGDLIKKLALIILIFRIFMRQVNMRENFIIFLLIMMALCSHLKIHRSQEI